MTSYVYEIRVDGVLRYIGKGRNRRVYSHMIEAKRTDKRCGVNTDHLSPYFHRKLVEAIRSGSDVTEKIIISDLTDEEAYRIEEQMIGEWHKHNPDQLWNTIDERFLDTKYLPEEWNNPVNPLYKLPRPLKSASGWIYENSRGKKHDRKEDSGQRPWAPLARRGGKRRESQRRPARTGST
jgi:hypothetical protein